MVNEGHIESPRDRLDRWVETGYSTDAVASNGTTLKVLRQILQDGAIPCAPAEAMTLPYQQAYVQRGQKLYYATPYIENMRQSYPDFAKEVLEHAQPYSYHLEKDKLVRQNVRRALQNLEPLNIEDELNLVMPSELTIEEVQDTSRFYAWKQSIAANFNDVTGVNLKGIDNVIGVSMKLFPKAFEAFKTRCPFPTIKGEADFEDNVDWKEVQKVIKALRKQPQLKPTWLDSPGVVIYFDRTFLEAGEPLLGHEDESEIMVATQGVLIPASAISGIEISKKDLSLLKQSM